MQNPFFYLVLRDYFFSDTEETYAILRVNGLRRNEICFMTRTGSPEKARKFLEPIIAAEKKAISEGRKIGTGTYDDVPRVVGTDPEELDRPSKN